MANRSRVVDKSVFPTVESDIKNSERKLRKQLQESNERYELAAKATHDVIYDIDVQRATVVWNHALYTQYGFKPSEHVDSIEWWAAHIHPEDAMHIEAEVTRLLESGATTWALEYRFQKADGNYIYVRDRVFVRRNHKGEPRRVIGSFLDITQQKQLDSAKDEFISLVSHQLRTPLTTIRLFSEMLTSEISGPLNSDQREQAQKITNASIRLIKLVSDVLNVSRIELDRIKIEPLVADANELIQSYVEEITPLAHEQGKTLVFKPVKDIKPVLIDPLIFCQVLQNLAVNALRYTQPKKGRIEIRFTSSKRGHVLAVSDNGIGIPHAAAAHIFDRLYRAPNAIETAGEGTGLGLYLVKLIADAFGGKVWFKNNNSAGTTFYIQIPPQGMQSKAGDRQLVES